MRIKRRGERKRIKLRICANIGLTARTKSVSVEHLPLRMYVPVELLLTRTYHGAKGRCPLQCFSDTFKLTEMCQIHSRKTSADHVPHHIICPEKKEDEQTRFILI